MTERRKRHFLIFLPIWIIPVFLIIFGSLINFHQNHIWGKQLLPHSFLTPRDKAKVLKIIELKVLSTDFQASRELSELVDNLPPLRFTHSFGPVQVLFPFLHAERLRAPPLA